MPPLKLLNHFRQEHFFPSSPLETCPSLNAPPFDFVLLCNPTIKSLSTKVLNHIKEGIGGASTSNTNWGKDHYVVTSCPCGLALKRTLEVR